MPQVQHEKHERRKRIPKIGSITDAQAGVLLGKVLNAQNNANRKEWTQEDLAGRSGVPKRTIQEIENGRVHRPQRATDLKLRQALDLEGNPETERAEWPEDVKAILDIVGATLMAITPAERVKWFAEFMRSDINPA